MFSLIFPASFAHDLSSLGVEYMTFPNRDDIVEVIESIDNPIIDFLIDHANYSYRINQFLVSLTITFITVYYDYCYCAKICYIYNKLKEMK